MQAGVQDALAASGPIKVTITNLMPKDTSVKLDGKTDCTISVRAGKTVEKTIDAGIYKLKYSGCLGKNKQGNLKIKQNTATVNIGPCKTATWVVTNTDTSSTFNSELKSWMTYKISVGPGQTMTYTLVADTYKSAATAGPVRSP